MSIEKLELVSIAGPAERLNDTIIACLQSNAFHMENAAKLLEAAEDGGGKSGENPYAEPLKRLLALNLRQNGIHPAGDPLSDHFTPEQISSETERISEKFSDIRTRLEQIQSQLTDDTTASLFLKNLQHTDIDLGELKKCSHILYRFGRMPEENVRKLEFYSEEGFIFQGYHTEHEYVWGFYFATPERVRTADAIMKGLLFERYELPKELSGTPEQALAELQIKMTELKAEEKQLQEKQKEMYDTEAKLLSRLLCYCEYQNEVYRLRNQCLILHDKFNMIGYVPVSEKQKLADLLAKVPGLSITYEPPEKYAEVQPPVQMKNGWFTKPFALFVEMYGLPGYNSFNPTTFLAITYTIMFGIMFGDLGQGILLALVGLFLEHKKKLPLGGIIARVGFSGAFFGALYGSVFGYENLLDPLYEKMGISFLPLHAMSHTNFIVFSAVGIGAAIILISILVNIVVRLRQKNYEEAVFGNNGIAGLLFFVSILMLVIGMVTGKTYVRKSVLILFAVFAMLLMFFREPLGALLSRKHYEMPGMVDFIASNFFECFEFLLGYATNTLSFIRVGGFVFSHAGLMSVVMMLADMAGKGASLAVIVIGNLFVMGLEGLIVGIQVLRLEFYEIFSRCYDGDGKAFTPISVSFDDSAEGADI